MEGKVQKKIYEVDDTKQQENQHYKSAIYQNFKITERNQLSGSGCLEYKK